MSLEAIIAIGFVALIVVETTISWLHNLRAYEFRDTVANFALAAGDLLMAAAMKAVFLALFALLHRFAPLDMGLSWFSWVLLVVINDLIYYVFHRLGHRCRFMWAFHVTHHSSQKYNFSVAVRLNLFILPLHFLFMLPLALLGFRPEAILAINSITTLYQLWVHTELIGKLGFLDRIFNTPSNHRVHHGSNPQYLDRNYGAMFIFWDHLFGTYEAEVEPVVYGLTRNVGSHNPVTLTLHETRAMLRDVMRPGPLRQRLMYLFGPPGWRPRDAGARRPAPGRQARRAAGARPRPRYAATARQLAAALRVVARRARWRPYQAKSGNLPPITGRWLRKERTARSTTIGGAERAAPPDGPPGTGDRRHRPDRHRAGARPAAARRPGALPGARPAARAAHPRRRRGVGSRRPRRRRHAVHGPARRAGGLPPCRTRVLLAGPERGNA